MKIALIGATGFVGGFILKEALDRGHEVTAISRHPENLAGQKNLAIKKCDIFDEPELSEIIKGHNSIISAYNPGWTNPKIYDLSIEGALSIISSVRKSGVKRLLVVGGAGSLEVAPGKQLVDAPDFPKEFKAGALGARDVLKLLKNISDLEWTFISPSVTLQPGERTGKFRLGTTKLLTNEKGESKISTQDLAVAILDEIENPEHIRMQFTAGY